MTAILSDEQIVTLLATDGGREAMLQEAARMGAMWAANVSARMPVVQRCWKGGFEPTTPLDCTIAIRAAAGKKWTDT